MKKIILLMFIFTSCADVKDEGESLTPYVKKYSFSSEDEDGDGISNSVDDRPFLAQVPKVLIKNVDALLSFSKVWDRSRRVSIERSSSISSINRNLALKVLSNVLKNKAKFESNYTDLYEINFLTKSDRDDLVFKYFKDDSYIEFKDIKLNLKFDVFIDSIRNLTDLSDLVFEVGLYSDSFNPLFEFKITSNSGGYEKFYLENSDEFTSLKPYETEFGLGPQELEDFIKNRHKLVIRAKNFKYKLGAKTLDYKDVISNIESATSKIVISSETNTKIYHFNKKIGLERFIEDRYKSFIVTESGIFQSLLGLNSEISFPGSLSNLNEGSLKKSFWYISESNLEKPLGPGDSYYLIHASIDELIRNAGTFEKTQIIFEVKDSIKIENVLENELIDISLRSRTLDSTAKYRSSYTWLSHCLPHTYREYELNDKAGKFPTKLLGKNPIKNNSKYKLSKSLETINFSTLKSSQDLKLEFNDVYENESVFAGLVWGHGKCGEVAPEDGFKESQKPKKSVFDLIIRRYSL